MKNNTKTSKIKQNVILFILLPLTTIILALLTYMRINYLMWKPQVNLNALSNNYDCGNLHEEIKLTDITDTELNIENKDIIIYSVKEIVYKHDGYEDKNYAIAFYGDKAENIDELVEDIKYVGGADIVSYWDGEYKILDLSKHLTVSELENEKQDKNVKLDSEIRLYNIDNYKGYKVEYNNGMSLASAFIFIIIVFILIILLAIELIIAIIIKVVSNKKQQ